MNATLKLLVVFLVGFYAIGYSQLEIEKNYGFNVGLVGAFGTHVQRFGISVQAYTVHDFMQLNGSFRLYHNFKNLGPKKENLELHTALGFCLGFGDKTHSDNWFISPIGNQTGYRHSVAYSYQIWINAIQTSQVTGLLACQFNHVSVICENDLLAKPTLDRFRTGAFLIQYQSNYWQYAINCTMWTGKLGLGMRNDSIFPAPGYVNMDGSVYGHLSHGLLSAQVKYANEFGQYLQANAGIDAEQVRDVVQNKIMHDMPFIPKRWNTSQNLHIPMIDTSGGQYLYRPDQKIRSPKLFLNGYVCPNIFY